jgi:hypothetical protein
MSLLPNHVARALRDAGARGALASRLAESLGVDSRALDAALAELAPESSVSRLDVRRVAWEAALAAPPQQREHPQCFVEAAKWARNPIYVREAEAAIGAGLWRQMMVHRSADPDGAPKSNWSTLVTEALVWHCLDVLGMHPRHAIPAKLAPTQKVGFRPDIETDDVIVEVKGRTWTTTGTAGEKVLGTPVKYAEIPGHYGKPLRIVLVGKQEQELLEGPVPLVGEHVRPAHRAQLQFWRDNHIEFVRGSDLLAAAGL